MDQKQTVVLYGDSLFMDSIEAGLGINREFDLVRFSTNVTNINKRLKLFHPDIVIFDILTLTDHVILSLLKDYPNILFLGLDINTNQIIALRSQCHLADSLADLTEIIRRRQLPGPETAPYPSVLTLEELVTQ